MHQLNVCFLFLVLLHQIFICLIYIRNTKEKKKKTRKISIHCYFVLCFFFVAVDLWDRHFHHRWLFSYVFIFFSVDRNVLLQFGCVFNFFMRSSRIWASFRFLAWAVVVWRSYLNGKKVFISFVFIFGFWSKTDKKLRLRFLIFFLNRNKLRTSEVDIFQQNWKILTIKQIENISGNRLAFRKFPNNLVELKYLGANLNTNLVYRFIFTSKNRNQLNKYRWIWIQTFNWMSITYCDFFTKNGSFLE